MIYIIACASSFLSGLGIGGGSIFILFSMLFKLLDLNEARAYNLLLFISQKVLFKVYIFGIIYVEIRMIVKRSSQSEVMPMVERFCFGIFNSTCSIVNNFER